MTYCGALVKKSKLPSRDHRHPVADVPAEVVIGQAERLAEVVAAGVGEDRDVGVEHDPVDDVLLADRPALGLPALTQAEPDGGQVARRFPSRAR